MNAIAITIVALGIAAVWHLIYEGIILPSARMKTRFQLFALRDRLRMLKIDHDHQCSDSAFHLLDGSLTWQMDNVHRITVGLLAATCARAERDASFVKDVELRLGRLDECRLPEFTSVREEQGRLYLSTLLLNSGGWLIYLVPVALLLATWKRMIKYVKLWNGMRSAELDRMSPTMG